VAVELVEHHAPTLGVEHFGATNSDISGTRPRSDQ